MTNILIKCGVRGPFGGGEGLLSEYGERVREREESGLLLLLDGVRDRGIFVLRVLMVIEFG